MSRIHGEGEKITKNIERQFLEVNKFIPSIFLFVTQDSRSDSVSNPLISTFRITFISSENLLRLTKPSQRNGAIDCLSEICIAQREWTQTYCEV
jgi:hypothetical protein